MSGTNIEEGLYSGRFSLHAMVLRGCCEDETTPASEQTLDWALRGSELHVPALWLWEIVNVLAVTVKRRRITTERAKDFLTELVILNFQIAPPPAVDDLPRLISISLCNWHYRSPRGMGIFAGRPWVRLSS